MEKSDSSINLSNSAEKGQIEIELKEKLDLDSFDDRKDKENPKKKF